MSDQDKGPGNPGKVENLKAMLAWQDHAIVSRMLVKNSGGSVTLFAFDAGEGETLLMPANVPHAVAPVGRFKMLLVMIRGEKGA